MKGTVRCARCQKARNKDLCPHCGAYACVIRVYWKGEVLRFWEHPEDGESMDFNRAWKLLINMEPSMKDGTFNKIDWKHNATKERRLEHQAFNWVDDKTVDAEKGDLSFEYIKNLIGYRDNWFIPHMGKMDVRKIQYEDLKAFSDKLPATLKSKTRRNIMNALRELYAWMHKRRVVTSIPSFPTIEQEDPDVRPTLTAEEQEAGIEKIPEQHRDVIIFSFEAGLRSGETCALKIKDINLKTEEAIIRRTWSGKRLREKTKGKNKLPVPLSEVAVEIARKTIRRRMEEKGVVDLNDFLFINPDTKRPYRQKILNNLSQDAFGISMHDACRHSFCSQLAEMENVSIAEIQRLARHADPRTTMKYIETRTSRLKGIVNRRRTVPDAAIGTNKYGSGDK